MSVEQFFVWSPIVGSLIAFVVCVRANALNRAEGLEADAPTFITGIAAVPALIFLMVFVAQAGLHAATGFDPCTAVSGDSWFAWFMRIGTYC